MVLSKPTAPQIFVECDALPKKCEGLLVHEPAVFEQGIGVTIIEGLDVRDSVCKALFEADEIVDRKFAGAPRIFDLLRVINKVDLCVGAFQKKISPAARFVLGMQENSTLHHFQVSNVCDFARQPRI